MLCLLVSFGGIPILLSCPSVPCHLAEMANYLSSLIMILFAFCVKLNISMANKKMHFA